MFNRRKAIAGSAAVVIAGVLGFERVKTARAETPVRGPDGVVMDPAYVRACRRAGEPRVGRVVIAEVWVNTGLARLVGGWWRARRFCELRAGDVARFLNPKGYERHGDHPGDREEVIKNGLAYKIGRVATYQVTSVDRNAVWDKAENWSIVVEACHSPDMVL